jgi:hypothetical protein
MTLHVSLKKQFFLCDKMLFKKDLVPWCWEINNCWINIIVVVTSSDGACSTLRDTRNAFEMLFEKPSHGNLPHSITPEI